MGTLYIVPTPIGNLSDITLRALKTLFNVQVIACEDTRRTGMLLDKLIQEFSTNPEEKQKPRFLSYYDQNELQRIPEIITLLQAEQDVALVSDAGTPAISDPGFKLVRECLKEKIKVVSLPGASSVLTALTASGLPTDKFLFAGYPPHKPGHRLTFFENIKTSLDSVHSTVILFEAPHKVIKTLGDMNTVFGDIEIVFARELTKIFEEVKKKKISDALLSFKKKPPKGEFVLLFHL
ncbi:MAG: 16S rRNA (cytidine(1402)-2'-O)-methyltransferase [Candidatus Levybacteria bacterium]|nr:16S rRNA (cytidine(1402)-2'-O)-methyltransferase [Candidatus Levybacteria bacterium]